MSQKFNETQLIENYNQLIAYVDVFFKDERLEKVKKLYADLADQIVMAPASAFSNYHGAYPGGYVEHVLNVIKHSVAMFKTWKQAGARVTDFTEEELIFSAMFHDLGKIGLKGVDFYVPEKDAWQIKNRGKMYDYNKKLQNMPHEDRSLFLLQKYGIELSDTEWITIKTHNGHYMEANKQYTELHFEKYKDFRTILPIIIHYADFMECRIASEQAGQYDFD